MKFIIFIIILVLLKVASAGLRNYANERRKSDVCQINDDIMLIPTQHYLNTTSCVIRYCRRRSIIYTQINEYKCKSIANYPSIYKNFYTDCVEKNCIQNMP